MKAYCKIKNGLKYITIETNFNIQKNSKYEFVFNIKNKKDNNIYEIKTKLLSFTIKNYFEIVRFKYVLENNIIASSKNVVYE